MTRILAVNGAFLGQAITGVQRYARELTAALGRVAGDRLRIVLLARRGDPLEASDPLAGAVEILRDTKHPPRQLWMQRGLPRLLRTLEKREGPALLWSPSNVGPLSVARQVVTIHDASVFVGPEWFSLGFRLWYRFLLPRLARRAALVVTHSEFSRGELARLGIAPLEKTAVVPCGVSAQFGLSNVRPSATHEGSFILSVGSLEPRKNLAVLLEAWRQLAPRIRGSHKLLIVGASAPAFAKARLGTLPDGVTLLGAMNDDELARLYATADAFVFPSLYEGFGLPPLEAMASGAPVVASRAASLPEVLGEAAAYFDPRSSEDLVRALADVLESASLRERLKSDGLARAAQFTWERAAEELFQKLEKFW